MKKYIIASLSILIALVAAVTIIVLVGKDTQKKPFTILISREPDSLNFLYSKQGVSLYVQKAIFRNLVEQDFRLNHYPELSEYVPTKENGYVIITPDNKMQVRWKLKENLKWADGKNLDTNDVIFTYNLLKKEDLISFSKEKMATKYIESIKAKNKREFTVTWQKPYSNYLYAHPILPKHILKKYLKTSKKLQTSAYNRKPIGNGPYKVKEWKAGSYILLERNEYYHKPVNMDKIAFKVVKDVNSLLINLISGEGQATTLITHEQYKFINKNYKKKLKTWTTESMSWLHIDLNLDNKYLKNKNIRKALIYAINRKQLAKSIYEGKEPQISRSWLPKKHYGYSVPSISYEYKKEKARHLIEGEGFEMGARGYYEKSGQILKLSLLTDSKDSVRKRIAIFIMEYLKEVGIKLNVKTYPTQTIFGKLLPNRTFDMALYAWHMNSEVDGQLYWSSDAIPGGGAVGLNFTGLSNKKIDKIHERLKRTISQAERIKLFKMHQELWKRQLPAIPLFIPYSLSATRQGLRNWRITGSSIPITWNCEEWKF